MYRWWHAKKHPIMYTSQEFGNGKQPREKIIKVPKREKEEKMHLSTSASDLRQTHQFPSMLPFFLTRLVFSLKKRNGWARGTRGLNFTDTRNSICIEVLMEELIYIRHIITDIQNDRTYYKWTSKIPIQFSSIPGNLLQD